MKREDWDAVAEDYRSSILSVYHLDKRKRILAAIGEFASAGGTAIDFGCGEGHFLPELSRRFAAVHGWDFSTELLRRARKRAKPNVALTCVDLSKGIPTLPCGDFVLSVNVLLSPQPTIREWLWKNLTSRLNAGGMLVLVVPALESAMLANVRLVEWNRRSGIPAERSVRAAFDMSGDEMEGFASDGLVNLDGVMTKHFLREELELMAATAGLQVHRFEKIEYPWTTEFNMPPAWMKAPFPWDWMMVAAR